MSNTIRMINDVMNGRDAASIIKEVIGISITEAEISFTPEEQKIIHQYKVNLKDLQGELAMLNKIKLFMVGAIPVVDQIIGKIEKASK
jgi:hypothetical protein